MEVFRSGFVGATMPDATKWVESHVGDAKTICVPFAGTGRDIVSMVGIDRCIESWDTQYYSRCIVEGIFAAKQIETVVDKLHYRKGWMYETRSIKYIDERSAGFIDWVAQEGTLFDKACLGSAIVRCSLMGRMTQWYANIEQLWARFERAREANKAYIGLPGEFIHHHESFFDRHTLTERYDLMEVDPPKVVIGSDVYSANFNNLNKALAQTSDNEPGPDLPRWSSRVVLDYFKQVMEVEAKRVIFLYVSKVKPTYEDVKKLLLTYAELEEEREFSHSGRTDFGLVLRRK